MILKKRLNELKSYLRIDGDDDDALLKMMMKAGEQYLLNAGIAPSDNELHRLALMLYVGVHYDHRDGSQESKGYSHSLQSVINQLKDGL